MWKAAIEPWLASLAESLAEFDALVGVWVHGSGTRAEDWVTGVSDVDVLVGWEDELTAADRVTLAALARHWLEACPAAGADLHIVARSTAAAPANPPSVELYASIHGATPAVQGPAHEMRLLFDFESARLSGRTVVGPPPEEFFSMVPRRRLLEAADQELREWEGYSSFHQPHMAALQAARAWMLADEFALSSKLAAGRWGLARWSNPALLEAAIARQLGDLGSRVDETEARELIAHAHERLRARLATEADK